MPIQSGQKIFRELLHDKGCPALPDEKDQDYKSQFRVSVSSERKSVVLMDFDWRKKPEEITIVTTDTYHRSEH